jgi:hypothetical protein
LVDQFNGFHSINKNQKNETHKYQIYNQNLINVFGQGIGTRRPAVGVSIFFFETEVKRSSAEPGTAKSVSQMDPNICASSYC